VTHTRILSKEAPGLCPLDQLRAKRLLEPVYMAADRTLRHGQLAGGAEAQRRGACPDGTVIG
jgi:hypothetical protein